MGLEVLILWREKKKSALGRNLTQPCSSERWMWGETRQCWLWDCQESPWLNSFSVGSEHWGSSCWVEKKESLMLALWTAKWNLSLWNRCYRCKASRLCGFCLGCFLVCRRCSCHWVVILAQTESSEVLKYIYLHFNGRIRCFIVSEDWSLSL